MGPYRALSAALLLHSLKHYTVLHEQNIILTVRSANVPRVESGRRLKIEKLSDNFHHIEAAFGYMESPNVPQVLSLAKSPALKITLTDTSISCPGALSADRDIRACPSGRTSCSS
jgi:KUP system potassium uptake protein